MVSTKRARAEAVASGEVGKGLKLAKAKEGGEKATTTSPTSAMVVRTVVRESHNKSIRKVAFNRSVPVAETAAASKEEGEVSNLFATVGGNQATIYDGSHFGEYVGLVVHYTHEDAELTTCAWLDAREHTKQPKGDCHLAFADALGKIGVVSVAMASVTHQLEGHEKEVTALATCASRPGYLLSLSKDETVKLWSVYEEACLATFEVGSGMHSIAWNPNGTSFLAGHRSGHIYSFGTDDEELFTANAHQQKKKEKMIKLELDGVVHQDAVDDITFLSCGFRVLTKSQDGRIFLSDLAAGRRIKDWRVQGGFHCVSNVDVTRDGKYFACGNSVGAVHVFELEGEEGKGSVAKLQPYKVERPVMSCAISDNYKNVLSSLGESFLFRYRHFTPKAKKEAEEKKEQEGGSS
jgi:WD40 repeat protein